MILWGSDGRVLDLGVVEERECDNCGTSRPFQLSLTYRFFYLYWIFRLVTKRTYWFACSVCDHGWELESAQVELATGKPPIALWDRYSLVVAVLLTAGLGHLLTPTQVERDQVGVIVEEGQVGAFQIRVGDCFNDDAPPTAQPEQDSVTEVAAVAGVPCGNPHDNEVYAVFDLRLSSFPGQQRIADLAQDACLERFAAFVGRAYADSALDVFSIFPSRESFASRSDREVVCSVYDMDRRKLIGSVRGSRR